MVFLHELFCYPWVCLQGFVVSRIGAYYSTTFKLRDLMTLYEVGDEL